MGACRFGPLWGGFVDVRTAVVALMAMAAMAFCAANAQAAAPSCTVPPGTLSPEVGDEPFIANCQDPDGEAPTVTITQQGTKGTASAVAVGPAQVAVQYEVAQEGADTVKFKVAAAGEESPEYTVDLQNVAAVNDPPQCFAFGDNPQVEVGDTIASGYCSDEEGDPITPEVTDAPEKGQVTFGDGGGLGKIVQYNASAEGQDSFKLKAGDGNSVGNERTYNTTNVPAVNDAPTCQVNPAGNTVELGEAEFVAGCSDDEGTPLTVTITQQPSKGEAAGVPVSGIGTAVEYRANELGADTFKVKANDGTQDSAELTVTTNNVAATNDPPACGGPPGIQAEIGEAQPVGSCFDDENDPLTITITQQGTKGTASVTTNGFGEQSVVYTASQAGQDTFKYRANDGTSNSSEVTVTTDNVAATNDPPVCTSYPPLTLEVGESTPDTGCFDEEGDPITLSVTQAPTKGTVAFTNNGTPNATGKYTATAVGQDTFKIKANDGTSDSNEATITTTNTAAANDPPLCGAGGAGPGTGPEVGEPVTVGGCIDEEDDNLDVTITQQGTKGTAVVIGDNTPNPTIHHGLRRRLGHHQVQGQRRHRRLQRGHRHHEQHRREQRPAPVRGGRPGAHHGDR